MKKHQILTILMALTFIFSLCACGNDAPSAAPSLAESTGSTVTEPVELPEDAAAEPAEEISVSEPAAEDSAEEVVPQPEEELGTITYPISGDYSFTMVANRANITAEAFANCGYEATPSYQAFQEITGVSLSFEMLAEQSATEKLNLIMASGDFPDLFNSKLGQYDSNVIGAIADGVLIDFSDLLKENAPDYYRFLQEHPDIRDSATNGDGSIAAFVSSTNPVQGRGLNIRIDWAKELGLNIPTTIEELTETLRVFKSEKGASMPLLTNSEGETGLSSYFQSSFGGFRSVDYQLTSPDSGEVVCVYAFDGFVNYLSYLHELYAEGLVSNDFLTVSREAGNYESSYRNGSSGIWLDSYNIYQPANLSLGEEGYEPAPFVLSGEEEIHVSDVSEASPIGTRIFISTACEAPEICLQLFNYCYTEDGQILTNFGVEDISYTYDDAGEIVFTDVVTNNPDGWPSSTAKAFYTGQFLPAIAMRRTLELDAAGEPMNALDLWTENAGDTSMTLPNGVSLDADSQSEFSALAGDVLTAVTEASIQVIVGDITAAEYQALIESLNATGLDRMTELYQEAYDNYMALRGA